MPDYFGEEVPKLGFGLMRLPKKGLGTDIEQVKTMVDLFMAAGFTYFDTAFVYTGSEAAIRKVLVERYPRDSYTLCTKIPDIFTAMNRQFGDGRIENARELYGKATADGGRARDCIECRQCENACPQHLPITDHLKQAVKMFEQ